MRRVADDDPRREDAELIRNRAVLTSNSRYRDETDVPLPNYFQVSILFVISTNDSVLQVGTIVSSVADRYSDVPRKKRKQTIVDEILADRTVLDYQRKQFKRLHEEERRASMRRGVQRRK